MSVLSKLGAAVKFGLKSWNPALHPRGRDGRFIEVGDKVRVFSGPGGPQIASGTVVAGHLGTDGRMWIGIRSAGESKVQWYRPKQIEEINPKATLPAAKTPLPLVGDKGDDVEWDAADADLLQLNAQDITSIQALGSAMSQSAIPETYEVANAAIAAANGRPGELAIDPELGLLVTPEVEGFIADFLTLSKGTDGRLKLTTDDPDSALMVAQAMAVSDDPMTQLVGSEMVRQATKQIASMPSPPPPQAPPPGSAPPPKPGAAIYTHPMGAVIYVNPDGSMEAYGKDGKKKTTSATPEKLLAGHGKWEAAGHADGSEGSLTDDGMPDPNSPTYEADLAAMESILEPVGWETPVPVAPKQTPSGAKLDLIISSAQNKGLSPGVVGLIVSSIEDALFNPDDDQATKSLNAAMTAAKLGGKQRKRYKELLAEHRAANGLGSSPSAPPPGPPIGSPAPGYNLPAIGATKPKSPPAVIRTITAMNKVINDPKVSAEKAKGAIQKALTDKLLGKVDPKVVAELTGQYAFGPHATNPQKQAPAMLYKNSDGTWVHAQGWGSGETMPGTPENYERANLENYVRNSVAEWAASSNTGSRAQAFQDIAADMFGIPPEWKAGWHFKAAGYDTEMTPARRAVHEEFLRAMYEHTQETYKAQGITHVRLHRGVKDATNRADGDSGSSDLGYSANEQYGTVKTRPLNSFATNLTATNQFGGFKMRAYVPIERLMGSALTGFGCKNEYEFVVIGGPGEYALWKK